MKMFCVVPVHRKRAFRIRRVIGALISSISLACLANGQMPPPTLTPEKIGMGAFYSGSSVHIHGSAPEAQGVLVVIRGTDKDEFLNRKGRVGIIWLNADRIHIKQAPSAFLRFSSSDVDSLLDRVNLDQYQLDELAVRKRVRCYCGCKCKLTAAQSHQTCTRGMQPDPAYNELLRNSFVNLKESEGSYHLYSGAVKITSLPDPATEYSLNVRWPKRLPPGNYAVEVYACRDRRVISHSVAVLELVEIGFPAKVANLAVNRPWIYGASAVLIAMLAGFGIDALAVRFRRLKGRVRAGETVPSPAKPEAAPKGTEPAEIHDREVVHRG